MAEKPKPAGVEVKLKWVVPNGLQTLRSTNVVIQRLSKEEYLVSFFEARLPVITGSAEEVAAEFSKITEVQAVCVARIVMTPDKYQEFYRAMSDSNIVAISEKPV